METVRLAPLILLPALTLTGGIRELRHPQASGPTVLTQSCRPVCCRPALLIPQQPSVTGMASVWPETPISSSASEFLSNETAKRGAF